MLNSSSTSDSIQSPINSNPETIEQIYTAFVRHLCDKQLVNESANYLKSELITNADRVAYVSKYLDELSLFIKIKKGSKNNKLSVDYRELGNKLYQKKQLNDALELYNKCIAFAEQENSTEALALGYANRSAVLFELNCFNECEEDIQRALFYDYPVNKRQKLLTRRNKIDKLKNQPKSHRFFNNIPFDAIGNRNEVIKCASSKIKIDFDPKIGRHVVATDDIEPGEIIAIEKPYIAVLLQDYFYTNCNYCFNYCLSPIPCENCPFALFCNDQCKENARKSYHRYECQLLTNVIEWNLNRMAQLALRVTLAAKDEFKNIAAMMQEPEDPSKLGLVVEDNQYVLDTNYTAIHYLITNTKMIPVNELCFKSVAAAILLNLLKQTDFFDGNNNDDISTTVAAELLLRHMQTAPSNFHQITAIKVLSDTLSEHVQIADGAFPFLSMLNHSCAPNVFRSNHGNTVILRALRPIPKNHQLFDNYGYHHALSSRADRLIGLKEQYYFDCVCEACENDWPTWTELENRKGDKRNAEITFLDELIPEISKRNAEMGQSMLPTIIEKLKKFEGGPSAELCKLQEVFKEIYFLEGNIFNILKPNT